MLFILYFLFYVDVLSFSALMLLVRWQEEHPACKKIEWWGTDVVICLERGADLHTAQHFHSLSLASVKSRLVLPFWYRLTWVVPEKGPLNGCVRVRVCVCDILSLATGRAFMFVKTYSVKLQKIAFGRPILIWKIVLVKQELNVIVR